MSGLRTRDVFEKEEAERLAAWAVKSAESRGRVVSEPEHAYRTAFQRDRDRIVHSRAFRRLEYKTQVFVHHEGDHYRNRLTHTLEGAQIARTIARALRLNEELAESVALAHDLGHTPFGHAGERALDACMREDGGFDHNRQSLRVVDLLEERYADFRGLNLTWETREGVCKHGCTWPHPVPVPELEAQPSLEAQAADAADEIAYINHDLDDGLRSGLLSLAQLEAEPLFEEIRREVAERLGRAEERVLQAQVIVALINALVTDLVEHTARRLGTTELGSVEDVRRCRQRMLAFSPQMEPAKLALKRFLRENLYLHPTVLRTTQKAERIVKELVETYRQEPALLPSRVRDRFDAEGPARAIADYVAGMTDRFAVAEHRKLLDPHDLL
ncbi:MAG: deoxyguanosinetriphosphate triphosphohydrolase [Proteobacteria bacterium]|nr:deoxyguanosinetriphosphate triphosphohydrolase [Pseudomonadota bacterium]